MIYFGNPCSAEVRKAMQDGLLGCITTPKQGNAHIPQVQYIADTGCFGKGYPGDAAWLQWLASRTDPSSFLFATAPDVVGDAEATLLRSLPHLPTIRKLGYPASFVGQDGLTPETTPWDEFDVLFLGGTTEWKLGPEAAELTALAIERGKSVHMGRVNSLKRLRYAQSIGCTSVDGTHLIFAPDKNLPTLLKWLNSL